MSEEGKGEISVTDAGRRGGQQTAARHGPEFYRRVGKKGAEKMRALIKKGRESEEQERGP